MMCIYKITDLTNGKIYIGKTNDIVRRINEYRYKSKNINNRKRKYRILERMNEIGFENFEFSILEEVLDESLLDEREIFWIEKLNARDIKIGYNSKTGGKGGTMIPYSINKMSESTKKFKHTEEEKKRRKKAIVVFIPYDDSIEFFDSAKDFAIKLDVDRSMITHAIKHGTNFKCTYVFYRDDELRKSTFNDIREKKINGGYNSKKSFMKYAIAYDRVNEKLKV